MESPMQDGLLFSLKSVCCIEDTKFPSHGTLYLLYQENDTRTLECQTS